MMPKALYVYILLSGLFILICFGLFASGRLTFSFPTTDNSQAKLVVTTASISPIPTDNPTPQQNKPAAITKTIGGNNSLGSFNVTFPEDWEMLVEQTMPYGVSFWKVRLSKGASVISFVQSEGGGPGECFFSDQKVPQDKDFVMYDYQKFSYENINNAVGKFRFPIKSADSTVCMQDKQGFYHHANPYGFWSIQNSNQNTDEITQILSSIDVTKVTKTFGGKHPFFKKFSIDIPSSWSVSSQESLGDQLVVEISKLNNKIRITHADTSYTICRFPDSKGFPDGEMVRFDELPILKIIAEFTVNKINYRLSQGSNDKQLGLCSPDPKSENLSLYRNTTDFGFVFITLEDKLALEEITDILKSIKVL